MLKTTLLVSVAALAATITFFTTRPSPAATPAVVQTHMGKTALGWYRIAVRRRIDRDYLQHRLGVRVRELIRMSKRFHAEPTRPPHYYEWLCIHDGRGAAWGTGEGSWTANTGNGYYGGLQFAHSTWERNGGHQYAPEANEATPLEQMWVAESAWRESGGTFSQWPNTARACGLPT